MGPSGRWLFFTAAPLRDASGAIIGAIETLQDISERKIVEDALMVAATLRGYALLLTCVGIGALLAGLLFARGV